jgi:hypothetical protein
MSDQTPYDAHSRRRTGPDPYANPLGDYVQRRRDRIRAEIQRNRRGGHKVPTWVLSAILIAIVAFWVGVIIFA